MMFINILVDELTSRDWMCVKLNERKKIECLLKKSKLKWVIGWKEFVQLIIFSFNCLASIG